MADLIVGPAVDLVIQKVVDCLKYQYNLRSGVEGKLKKLEEVLIRIKAVAKPADDLDLDDHEDLKKWMQGLKVFAEEASDVLDEFEYLCLKRQAEDEGEGEGEGDGADNKGPRCFPLSFEGLRSSISSLYKYATRSLSSLYKCYTRFVQSTDPLERLMSIQSKLDDLDSNSNQFLQLVKDRKATVQEYHIQESRNRETGSTVIEHEWVGRHDVLEEIIKKLLEEEESVSEGKSIPFLAVVGHGGMGKTTLTQHIFNHTKVKSHFDTRMWAYVSQVFDVPTITRRIIESAAPNERFSNTESLETLQQKLKDTLNKSMRFLLVLDDVWYGQNKFLMEEQWNKLCSPLAEVGGKGSKILLTSRTPEVKDLHSPLITMISLQGLKQDECWSIIQRSAFQGHENLDSYQHLVRIGKKIALKVHGSPLAAKAVGGILRKELNLTHWTNILNMELSKIGEDYVMPVLKLSYRHLPPHLRQCFAYCSLFPKGHKFNVDMLIRMWVAHGYIQEPTGDTTEEEIGWSYFGDLLSAGFFTATQINVRIIYAEMHDLLNDLARFVSNDEFRYIEDDGGIPETVRHLSMSTNSYLAELIKKKCILSNLQSLLIFTDPGCWADFDDKLVKDVLHQLRRVRVLDLTWCPMEQLPDDIGSLVHLRYLDLSWTEIASLPESFWRLYHLQVLNKPNFRSFDAPLEKLNHLVKLRYLGYDQAVKLSWMKGLKSLQVVTSGVVVEEGRGGEIGNLKTLNELREELFLEDLDYVESGAAAREADLCRKKRLKTLVLRWRESSACRPDMVAEVLEGLQPPSSLEQLEIHNYPGMAWPNWLDHTSLNKLEIEDMDGRGGLPYLKMLIITKCPNLRALPTLSLTLTKLEITVCPNLRELPILSLTLTELRIVNVGISSLPVLDDPNIRSSSSNGTISSSSKLSKLTIEDCENLTSLGEGLLQNHQRLMDLEAVTIRRCKLLVSLPDRGFREFNSLKRLRIENCPTLTLVAPNQDLDRGVLPPSLEELSLSHLVDETLSGCLQGLSNLSKLEVASCPCLKSMPSREELVYLTSLQELSICSCQSLTPSTLEDIQNLPSLKQLKIQHWPALTPPVLEGLRALASLKQLEIYGCPGLLLETSSISTADNREGMGRGPFSLAIEHLQIGDPLMLIKVPVLKSLTTVQYLDIDDASRLISPELENWFLQNGTSLRKLIIRNARQLQALPDLPKSLEFLDVHFTNQEFKKRYERDIGPDWDKIRHIKSISIT